MNLWRKTYFVKEFVKPGRVNNVGNIYKTAARILTSVSTRCDGENNSKVISSIIFHSYVSKMSKCITTTNVKTPKLTC